MLVEHMTYEYATQPTEILDLIVYGRQSQCEWILHLLAEPFRPLPRDGRRKRRGLPRQGENATQRHEPKKLDSRHENMTLHNHELHTFGT
jgi:hypothetical protein